MRLSSVSKKRNNRNIKNLTHKNYSAIAIRRRKKRGPGRVIKQNPHRINDEIKAREVRLVGDNVEVGIYPLEEALKIADEQNLDLVEISPKADPPVCKILDYKKFLYDQKKKEKAIKQKTQKVVVKEIRFGPQTDDHDYEFKKKYAIKFLQEGNKVKAYVFFRGRSIIYKDQGQLLLLRLAQDLEEYVKVEQLPKMEGKKMIMILAPLSKKKK